jgi:hypothetical protein
LNYFVILLGNLTQVIEEAIQLTVENILEISFCKHIIIKFDRLRSDFMTKILTTADNANSDMVPFLSVALTKIRFILNRFGILINFFDVLENSYKRKQITNQVYVP